MLIDTIFSDAGHRMAFRGRSHVVWVLPFLVILSGCDSGPACDSVETRKAVLQFVLDDPNNALGNFAAKASSPQSKSQESSKPDDAKQRPVYQLGQKLVTRSVSKDKRTSVCSGAISATVGDTKASKEVDFTVQQQHDGKISVSVAPFEFQAPPADDAQPKAD